MSEAPAEQPPQDLAALLDEAIRLHQRGELAQAQERYEIIRTQDPRHFTATHLLGVIKRQSGDLEAAFQLLTEALALNPRSALAHLNLGLTLRDLERPTEALAHLRHSLRLQPQQPEALLNQGILLCELGRPAEAILAFDHALARQPHCPEALLHRGLAHQGLHNWDAALADCDLALEQAPGWVPALLNRATALHLLGRPEAALLQLEHLLVIDPGLPEALLNCGMVLRELRRPEEALQRFNHLLRLNPEHREAHLNRGRALRELHRPEEALASFERGMALNPNAPEALQDCASALMDLGRGQEALACLDRGLAQQPDNPDLRANRGAALLSLGQPKAALLELDHALALNPAHGEGLLNRGTALLELQRPVEALACYEAALTVRPNWVEALMSRGTALLALQRGEEAMASYDQALALAPNHVDLLTNRGTALHRLGHHREAIASYDQALALRPSHARARSNKIFVLDYLAEVDFEAHQQARQAYFQALCAQIPSLDPVPRDPDPARPLVLGYVSADFRRHSAASCFGPILWRHDHRAFRVICYAGNAQEDDWTERFKAAADLWRPMAELTDEALATQVRADGVDILVDLSGHSEGNRLRAFARKPAPLQITAWGHGGGTGLPQVDFQFTDSVTIPPEARHLFAEKCYDLPCCITFEAPGYAPAVNELPALSNGFVTFGSLNRFMKNTPEVLSLWARILQAVPESRLLMKDSQLSDPGIQAVVREQFTRRGIAGERLLFQGFSSHQAHLGAHGKVDIVLDTFPQNGGITVWEALWMGTPVVALLGNKPPSRLSAAILHALNLGEWVSGDPAGYVARAVHAAADLGALAQFRREIRARIVASEAGNPERYTRAVEAAYRKLWQQRVGS